MFISLEGNNKTEKLYIVSLNKDHGAKFALQFTTGRDTDMMNMWKALCNLMAEGFSTIDGDKAFCLCDQDYEPYKIDRIRTIKQEIGLGTAKLIVSNPCFEIWFLNHFQYSTREFQSNRELIGDLRDYIPCFEKNTDYYHLHLKSRTANAINNSLRQLKLVNENNQLSDVIVRNPGTEVAEIVQTIIGG